MNLDDAQQVLITINGQTASKRTRNRIRDHGPRFLLTSNTSPHQPDSVHIFSCSSKWSGWIAKREIIIHKVFKETTNEN